MSELKRNAIDHLNLLKRMQEAGGVNNKPSQDILTELLDEVEALQSQLKEKEEQLQEKTLTHEYYMAKEYLKNSRNQQGVWLSMESVPRDGTVIDLWHKDGFRVTEVWWDDEDKVWTCLLNDDRFTHWMVVPDAPSKERIE